MEVNVDFKQRNIVEIYRDLGLNERGKVQTYLDKRIAENLQSYVSYREGTQEKSIPLSTVYGSGYVTIGVKYATYQAYSKKIKKRVGRRGTKPFERMVADKGQSILRELEDYARRISK